MANSYFGGSGGYSDYKGQSWWGPLLSRKPVVDRTPTEVVSVMQEGGDIPINVDDDAAASADAAAATKAAPLRC